MPAAAAAPPPDGAAGQQARAVAPRSPQGAPCVYGLCASRPHRTRRPCGLACVLAARGWKPHFSNTDSRTRSGVIIGVNPAAATCRMEQSSQRHGQTAMRARRAGLMCPRRRRGRHPRKPGPAEPAHLLHRPVDQSKLQQRRLVAQVVELGAADLRGGAGRGRPRVSMAGVAAGTPVAGQPPCAAALLRVASLPVPARDSCHINSINEDARRARISKPHTSWPPSAATSQMAPPRYARCPVPALTVPAVSKSIRSSSSPSCRWSLGVKPASRFSPTSCSTAD